MRRRGETKYQFCCRWIWAVFALYDLSIYPFKNIGILSGNDLEHVIWENTSNSMPFNVNDIYDGTTILHLVITKSNASLQKTLNRIDALRKYNISVDIPDA